MGYDTIFKGFFLFDRPLTQEQIDYLKKFSETRRTKRDPEIAKNMPDPLRLAVSLPIGEEAEYFVNGKGCAGQDRDESTIDSNKPPGKQPQLWCQWEPNDKGTRLRWNKAEKFYAYIHWLIYMIDKFFIPWQYKLNGKVRYYGEGHGDTGVIIVENNNVYHRYLSYNKEGRVKYRSPRELLYEMKTEKLE